MFAKQLLTFGGAYLPLFSDQAAKKTDCVPFDMALHPGKLEPLNLLFYSLPCPDNDRNNWTCPSLSMGHFSLLSPVIEFLVFGADNRLLCTLTLRMLNCSFTLPQWRT